MTYQELAQVVKEYWDDDCRSAEETKEDLQELIVDIQILLDTL